MKLFSQINSWRADPSGWVGSAIMFSFAMIAAFKWQSSGLIFYALVVLRDVAASWFLLTRNQASQKSSFGIQDGLAYVSSAMPFIYFSSSTETSFSLLVTASILAIIGFVLSTLSLIELGSSFGVSPANRGVVRSGVYRFVRHPMYTGYVIGELGLVFFHPMNALIFALSVLLYWARTKYENNLLYSSSKLPNNINSYDLAPLSALAPESKPHIP